MKTGHVEKTNDRDYEVEERRFRTMEAAALRLQKEARGYLDSLRGKYMPTRITNTQIHKYTNRQIHISMKPSPDAPATDEPQP